MDLKLFEHNKKAYDAACQLMDEEGKAVIIHPTGTGKSLIAFQLALDHQAERVLWLSPSAYIFRTQLENVKKVMGFPDEDAGNQMHIFSNILFLTYAKLMHNEILIEDLAPNYIILDEFHRCGASEWGRSVRLLLETYPNAKVLGLSATNIRYLDNQRDMAEELFDGNIASELSLGEAIGRKILPAPTYICAMYDYQEELKRLKKRLEQVKQVSRQKENEKLLEQLRRTLEHAQGLDKIFERHMKAVVQVLFQIYEPDIVVNLAAQAGVRYSITNPDVYVEANLCGFYNILEACRHSYDNGKKGVEHLVYASSSSVYGSNKKVPYSTEDKVDNPVSLYAATKKSNELLAHAYSKLYNIPSTGLRFFTVYGPAGRPDMAYFGFTNKLLAGEKIQIFNYGNCKRDFTYVDDIVEGVIRVMQKAPEKRLGEDGLPIPPYAVYNIGNNQPENLLDFVDILQQELIRAKVLPKDYDFEAHKELVPMQPGDVPITYADTSPLEHDFGFKPNTSLREGLRKFAEWYKEFYCTGINIGSSR